MTRLTITCESCGLSWTVASTFSIYEQQTIESSPCPHCAAYTLCCHRPDALQSAQGPHAWRERNATGRRW